MRHLLTLFDLTPQELQSLLGSASELKRQLSMGDRRPAAAGHVLGLLFEKNRRCEPA